MIPHDVRAQLATREQHETIVELCVAAFADEPLTSWVHPEESERAGYLRPMFDVALSEAIDARSVMISASSADLPLGAAMWQAHPPAADQAIPGNDPLAQRLRAVQTATARRRPTMRHLYLPSMAVHPEHRNRGLGAALLMAVVEQAATENVPVYLEASSPANRRFYTRHGFRDVGRPIEVARDAPQLQPMLFQHE